MNKYQKALKYTKQRPDEPLEARRLRVTIGGQGVDHQGAGVARGDEVEDQGEDGEPAEEGPDVPVAHHQVKPHLRHLPAAQPRQAPVSRGCSPPDHQDNIELSILFVCCLGN